MKTIDNIDKMLMLNDIFSDLLDEEIYIIDEDYPYEDIPGCVLGGFECNQEIRE